jgi:hypothetical protein
VVGSSSTPDAGASGLYGLQYHCRQVYCQIVLPWWSKILPMKLVGYWCLGLSLGLAFGALPLICARIGGSDVDPADRGASYLMWVGGSFAAAVGLAYVRPRWRWLWGLTVFLGFFAAFALLILIEIKMGVPNNLWPLSLAFAITISAPAAFAGAYFGSKLGHRKPAER